MMQFSKVCSPVYGVTQRLQCHADMLFLACVGFAHKDFSHGDLPMSIFLEANTKDLPVGIFLDANTKDSPIKIFLEANTKDLPIKIFWRQIQRICL